MKYYSNIYISKDFILLFFQFTDPAITVFVNFIAEMECIMLPKEYHSTKSSGTMWMEFSVKRTQCGVCTLDAYKVVGNCVLNNLKGKKSTSFQSLLQIPLFWLKVLENAYFSCQTFSLTSIAVSYMFTIRWAMSWTICLYSRWILD